MLGEHQSCISSENAKYLGKTYVGFGSHAADFEGWSFTRADQGRNIAMTVAVTPGDCVPVMETITGYLGQGTTCIVSSMIVLSVMIIIVLSVMSTGCSHSAVVVFLFFFCFFLPLSNAFFW